MIMNDAFVVLKGILFIHTCMCVLASSKAYQPKILLTVTRDPDPVFKLQFLIAFFADLTYPGCQTCIHSNSYAHIRLYTYRHSMTEIVQIFDYGIVKIRKITIKSIYR